jgi:hypothetical protein
MLLLGHGRELSAAWPFSGSSDGKSENALTDTSGPWLISIATFGGSKAEAQAQELAAELHRDHGLKTYVYGLHSKDWRKKLNSAAPELGTASSPNGEVVKVNYQKKDRPDAMDYAVVVGDFQSVDDKNAQQTLRKVKQIQPKTFERHKEDSARLLNEAKAFFGGKTSPLSMAFLMPNPRLPAEYFAPKGPDKFVLDLNKDFKYSLLNCKSKYSLKVASFRGTKLVDQIKIKETESGMREIKSHLVDAAESAHALCESLRRKGVEAYEFHDRTSSIVTVGSFDNLGLPDANGQAMMNPVLEKLLKDFGPDKSALDGSAKPRVIKVEMAGKVEGVPLGVPEPIEVPRRSISQDYARSSR